MEIGEGVNMLTTIKSIIMEIGEWANIKYIKDTYTPLFKGRWETKALPRVRIGYVKKKQYHMKSNLCKLRQHRNSRVW